MMLTFVCWLHQDYLEALQDSPAISLIIDNYYYAFDLKEAKLGFGFQWWCRILQVPEEPE